MKKKRFYNNKKRNTKWTEKETGHKISFADKYIDTGCTSDKFDKKRPKKKKKKFITKEKTANALKGVLIVIFCFALLNVGYSVMDLYIDRNAMPDEDETIEQTVNYSELDITVKGMAAQSISLDAGVMLEAVIDEAQNGGYSSISFDLKRDDGTIGYESSLATISSYGAISSPSANLKDSVTMLTQADILPVARISCYKDNIVAVSDLDSALKDGKSTYTDSDGNTYLNPNSDTVYEYIRSIIEETNSMGISVYLLANCTLPDDVDGDYNDGFEALSEKLYADFGEEIKFIEAVDVEITDEELLEQESEENESNTDESTTEESTSEYDYTSSYDYDETDETQTTQSDTETVEQQIEENIKTLSSDKIYYITTNNPDEVKKILDNKDMSNYIIVAEN